MLSYINFYNIILNQLGGKEKKKYWDTMSHSGVMFAEDYNPINIPIVYDGKEIILNPEAEEAATFYVRYLNTEYVNNSKFSRNFWSDFKKLVSKELNITDFDKIDFTMIKKYIEKENEKRLNMSKEEKAKIKEEQKIKEEKYMYALIDGKKQPVGNFRIEPPGIFLGRGCHPLIGKLKKRIYPEDITINIGKGEKIPETGYKDRNWKEVIHDKNVIWLASWKENISNKTKYVFLSDKSDFKSESDKSKFELARKLKNKFNEIKKVNDENLKDGNEKIRQLATALYFIENLSLRVGNEKGKDEADTVGVTSLRIEHIDLLEKNIIKLDFLGKDSIRYTKKFEVDEVVYQNLLNFTKDKYNKDDLFDKINPSELNGYLQNFMKGLTSKVFRTMNASRLFQKELNKISSKFDNYDKDDKLNLILDEYMKANAKVALLCNHQKNVNKNFKDMVSKFDKKVKDGLKKKKEFEEKKLEYKEKGKDTKSITKKINRIDEIVRKLKSKKKVKIDLKNVSLGTSKINYIDPRISIAFIKRHDMEIDKIFTTALQEKFTWALDVDKDFKF